MPSRERAPRKLWIVSVQKLFCIGGTVSVKILRNRVCHLYTEPLVGDRYRYLERHRATALRRTRQATVRTFDKKADRVLIYQGVI